MLYMRQPLYNRDFCRIIVRARAPVRAIYDIVGDTRIDYVDIHTIRRVRVW